MLGACGSGLPCPLVPAGCRAQGAFRCPLAMRTVLRLAPGYAKDPITPLIDLPRLDVG